MEYWLSNFIRQLYQVHSPPLPVGLTDWYRVCGG